MSENTTFTSLVNPYLEKLASDSPTPGGGSAAAVSGAIATSLLEMVASISLKKATGEAAEVLDELIPIFGRSREVLIELGGEDEKAYGGYRAARSLPRSTPDEKAARTEALEEALITSTAVPLETAELALELVQLIPALNEVSSEHMVADVTVGTALLGACINGAVAMVNTNLSSIKDESARDEITERVEKLLQTFSEMIEAEWEELEDEEFDEDKD